MYEVEFTLEYDGEIYDIIAWAQLLDGPEGTEIEDFSFKARNEDGIDVTDYAIHTDELYDEINDKGAKELLDVYHDLP